VTKLKLGVAFLATGSALLSLTACGVAAANPGSTPTRSAAPQLTRSVEPAGDAGGACQLLDYDDIQETLGDQFSIAAASQVSTTFTCVVQGRGKPLPDLTLSVTGTAADDVVFKSTVQPNGATPVPGVGKVAYQAPIAATADAGPGIDIGWLAGNARLIDLRLRLSTTATPQDVADAGPRLIALAKRIDLSSI
jgi:hypothetical protein